MNRKPAIKPYWEMSTDELREATKDFDEEFVADQATEPTLQMQSRLERAKNKSSSAANGVGQQTITVRVDDALLDQCTALAKKKRISRDTLIARGLRAVLAAEGEALR